MEVKEKKKINWVAIFNFLWMGPLVIGVGSFFFKLIGVLKVSWLIALSPLIFSYGFFALIMLYVAFLQERIEKLFKKTKNQHRII